LGQRAFEKPTILVINRHTLSDGEDFTEGYRTLKLGKVIGEPTAGWIIYTSDAPLIDGTTVRLPSTRIRDTRGQDMEMHPRPVDQFVARPLGETYVGKDSQLDAAVTELMKEFRRSERRCRISREDRTRDRRGSRSASAFHLARRSESHRCIDVARHRSVSPGDGAPVERIRN